ncbi:MAG: hypothetical protein N2Z40_04830 [Caldimicrobium sp.]|nr:hypothetical protein [Caldimicrobium sp.]
MTSYLAIPPKVRESLEVILFVKRVWKDLFAEKADLVVPLNFRDGTLYIGVSHHYELQNLYLDYLNILNKMKSLYPASQKFPIKNLKFLFWGEDKKKRVNYPRERISFSAREWRDLEQTLLDISDGEMRLLFQRAIKSYLKAHREGSF